MPCPRPLLVFSISIAIQFKSTPAHIQTRIPDPRLQIPGPNSTTRSDSQASPGWLPMCPNCPNYAIGCSARLKNKWPNLDRHCVWTQIGLKSKLFAKIKILSDVCSNPKNANVKTNWPGNQPANQPASLLASHPARQQASRPVMQPANKPASQPSQTIEQSKNNLNHTHRTKIMTAIVQNTLNPIYMFSLFFARLVCANDWVKLKNIISNERGYVGRVGLNLLCYNSKLLNPKP